MKVPPPVPKPIPTAAFIATALPAEDPASDELLRGAVEDCSWLGENVGVADSLKPSSTGILEEADSLAATCEEGVVDGELLGKSAGDGEPVADSKICSGRAVRVELGDNVGERVR